MARTDKAFSRVKIDAQFRDQGWEVLNTNAVRFESLPPDRTKGDYVLCDRMPVVGTEPEYKNAY